MTRKGTRTDTDRNGMKKVGMLLEKAWWKAVAEDRITIGTCQCARNLQGRTDQVLYCILPQCEDKDDYLMKIERIFLEAFCRENKIFIIRIDDCMKLKSILQKHDKKHKDQDFHCAMVYASKSIAPCQEDVILMNHCREVTRNEPWLMVHVTS